jgi:hypothetical protein
VFEDIEKMTKEEREEEIALVTARLKELNATLRSDWQAGFEALLRIDTHKYGSRVHIDTDVELGVMPPRTDYMIITEDEAVEWDKSIFQIFRKFNIIEYENPKAELNMRVIFKAVGYAELYVGLAEHEGERPYNQVTISIFRDSKNDELFRELENMGRLVSDAEGIYRVSGFTVFPLQIIVTSELAGDEYAAYRALTDGADDADFKNVVEWSNHEPDEVVREYYRTVIKLMVDKNPQFDRMIRRDKEMEDRLMEILKDRVDERVNEAVAVKEREDAVAYLTAVIGNLGCTPEYAMDLMGIPEQQRDSYAELLGANAR